MAAVLRHTVRASSAVECMNSVLRMHQGRHRTVTQPMLDLKRLYWNCRPFQSGQRRGHCPYELPIDWARIVVMTLNCPAVVLIASVNRHLPHDELLGIAPVGLRLPTTDW